MKIAFILPVYNEEKDLKKGVLKLYNYLVSNKIKSWKIIIADNASTDKTPEIGKQLAKNYTNVFYFYLPIKGRGYALRKTYNSFNAKIYFYMDIDLSTDLNHIKEVLNEMNYNDIVIGTRLSKNSKVERSLFRELISRTYNLIARFLTKTKVSDLQCGFKAINNKIIEEVIPLVKDNNWFFDSEMLIIAEKRGYKIKEIPIKWTDDPYSKVKILETSLNYLKNLLRLRNFITKM